VTTTSGAPARLTIAADASRLAEGRAFVRALAASVDADEETTSDLVQAVDELACNVIEHGYRHAPGEIELEGLVDAEAIVVRLRDGAPPFDPRSVPEPRLDLPLAHRPFGGMGVHLARTLTDAMDHRILPGGGNEVTVTKRLRRAADGAAREVQEGDDGHHDRATER
jgi:serine/threonine-protein kinase RsbW